MIELVRVMNVVTEMNGVVQIYEFKFKQTKA